MSDSGDESDGWEIEKIALRLKKYRRELHHSRRGNHSLEVQNKIKLRLADLSKRLSVLYGKKFNAMKTNASTHEEDFEEVGMRLCNIYDEVMQLDTIQGINHCKTRAFDIHSSLFHFFERKCSNLPASIEVFTDHDKLSKKLQVIASRIKGFNRPLMRCDWERRIARLKQPWAQFYGVQLKGLPVSFVALQDAESIAEKLKNLYSEMTKLEPESFNNWPGKIIILRDHLIKFLSELLAKLPVCLEVAFSLFHRVAIAVNKASCTSIC